jgi:hypothetical protein
MITEHFDNTGNSLNFQGFCLNRHTGACPGSGSGQTPASSVQKTEPIAK